MTSHNRLAKFAGLEEHNYETVYTVTQLYLLYTVSRLGCLVILLVSWPSDVLGLMLV